MICLVSRLFFFGSAYAIRDQPTNANGAAHEAVAAHDPIHGDSADADDGAAGTH